MELVVWEEELYEMVVEVRRVSDDLLFLKRTC